MAETLGTYLRKARKQTGMSLRRLARQLEVTAAHLSDIERDRRRPSIELLGQMAQQLGLPLQELERLDPRIRPEVKGWLADRGEVRSLLRHLREDLRSDALVRGVATFIGLTTYESEIRAIAADAAAWDHETGGDLFGRWTTTPTIYLATRAGPNAVRDRAHFRLDVAYLRRLSQELELDWALRYFGDWHSHHRLGLASPSQGDRERIRRLAARNGYTEMAEFIVTLEDLSGEREPIVRVHPYIYRDPHNHTPLVMPLTVLPGMSPVRDALLVRGIYPEQELARWEQFPLARLRIGLEPTPPRPAEVTHPPDEVVTNSALRHARLALEVTSGGPIEHHLTAFGHVLVVPVAHETSVAFALDRSWPFTVLEIDWIDRSRRNSEPLPFAGPANAVDLSGLIALYHEARERRVEVPDVDDGAA